MVAAVALLLAAVLAADPAVQDGGGAGRRDEPSTYPYVMVPVNALWGHLLEGLFVGPTGVFFEPTARELFVADRGSGLVGIFDEAGTPLFTFGRPPLLYSPRQVAATPDGTIYVLDDSDNNVYAFSYRGEPRGTLAFEYPALGEEPGGVARVAAFALDERGRWFVADFGLPQVLAYDADLGFRFAIRNQRAGARFGAITGLAVSAEGLIAVTDQVGTPVQVFDAEGKFLSGFGKRDLGEENFTATSACGFDENGYLFVVDMLRHDVKIFEPSGTYLGMFGGWFGPQTRGVGPGEMRYPTGIAFGPERQVWVVERFGRRVQVFRRETLEDLQEGAAGGADRPSEGSSSSGG